MTLLLCLQRADDPERVCFSEIRILSTGHIVVDLLLCHPDYRSIGLGSYMMYKIEQLACRLLPSQPIVHLVGVVENLSILKHWGFQQTHQTQSSRLSFFNDPKIVSLHDQGEFNGICVKMKKNITISNALRCPVLTFSVGVSALHYSYSACLHAQISVEKIQRKIKKQWKTSLRAYKKAWSAVLDEGEANEAQLIRIDQLWLHDMMQEQQLTTGQRNAVIESYFTLRIIKNNLALCDGLHQSIRSLQDVRSHAVSAGP